jgi:serine-type D-Ala-D-Ala carboxypeptidase (penicillin-binding protein 5/6)
MSQLFLGSLLLVASLPVPPAWSQAVTPPKPKLPADRIDGPPVVSARAWAVADGKTGRFLWGSKETEPRAMASTTKIMTAFIILELAAKDPKLLDEILIVSERAAKTGGSGAKIRTGERYIVRELLYGLLLPSGNDAAVALAEHFGRRACPEGKPGETSLALFVRAMNRRARELKLTATKYLDPHGLSRNQSSARDLTVLAWHALQNEPFRRYVQTRTHRCTVMDTRGEKRSMTWTNTNRLLGIQGYDGVKTGTTGAAGSCLVASGRHAGDHLLVVVLGCTSNDSRYVDSRNLFRWAWRERQKPGK